MVTLIIFVRSLRVSFLLWEQSLHIGLIRITSKLPHSKVVGPSPRMPQPRRSVMIASAADIQAAELAEFSFDVLTLMRWIIIAKITVAMHPEFLTIMTWESLAFTSSGMLTARPRAKRRKVAGISSSSLWTVPLPTPRKMAESTWKSSWRAPKTAYQQIKGSTESYFSRSFVATRDRCFPVCF